MRKSLKYIPIIGNVYNFWTVISSEIFKIPTNNATYWKVRCKCNREFIRSAKHIIEGKSKQCRKCSSIKNSFELDYFNKIKRGAFERKIDFNLLYDDIYNLLRLQNYKCALSGESISICNSWNTTRNQTASLDRIDSSKGYTIDNIQWVHKEVNFMKNNLTTKRLLELCQKIIQNSKNIQ